MNKLIKNELIKLDIYKSKASLQYLYSQTPIKWTPLGPDLRVRLKGVNTVGGMYMVTSLFGFFNT